MDDSCSNDKHLRYRISQAVSAAKKLKPLMSHSCLPPSWKLLVYRSIIQSILMSSMESVQLSPAQLIHLDSIYYKQVRRIFKVKSSFYHRVIEPTEAGRLFQPVPRGSCFFLTTGSTALSALFPSAIAIVWTSPKTPGFT